MIHISSRSIVAWVVALCLAGGALAQPAAEPTAARWWRELSQVRQQLVAGQSESAYEDSRRLVGEMIGALKAGGPANDLIAVALAQLALAEAGQAGEGSLEDAAWHLEMATIFNPAFGETRFEEFGLLGSRLLEVRGRRASSDPAEGEVLPSLPVPGLEPPEILESPHMVFRASREVLEAMDHELRVEVVVDVDGRVRSPEIVGRLDNPAPVVLSLDLLRGWRFEPARIGVNAVPVRYALDLPLTEGAVRRAQWDLSLWRVSNLIAGEELRAARTAAARLLLEVEASPSSASRARALGEARAVLQRVDRLLAGGS